MRYWHTEILRYHRALNWRPPLATLPSSKEEEEVARVEKGDVKGKFQSLDLFCSREWRGEGECNLKMKSSQDSGLVSSPKQQPPSLLCRFLQTQDVSNLIWAAFSCLFSLSFVCEAGERPRGEMNVHSHSARKPGSNEVSQSLLCTSWSCVTCTLHQLLFLVDRVHLLKHCTGARIYVL